MKNRRIRNAAILASVVLLLVNFVVNPYSIFGPIASTEAKLDRSDYEALLESYGSVDAALEQILADADSDFFGGYAVDETFLSWLYGAYGWDAIVDLAYQMYEGNREDNLWYEITGSTMHVLWLSYCKHMGIYEEDWQDVIWQEESGDSDGTVTIDFVGDICFDADWYPMEAKNETADAFSDCFSEEVLAELNGADITVVNNEFTYTTEEESLSGKAYTFKADPVNVGLLKVLGTDLVALANNHVYDYGEAGLIDTLETLEEAGYPYMGAGRNIEEASKIVYYVVNGRKIAFVNGTEIERYSNYTQAASDNTAGVLKFLDPEVMLRTIAEADANSDYVIVYAHWGVEGRVYYDSSSEAYAEMFAEAGADAIIGGHPHRLQGVSFVDNVPVAYSLGNFWFSDASLYATIAQITIDASGELSLRMLPCVQSNLQVTMLTEEADLKGFYEYLADISTDVVFDETGKVYDLTALDEQGEPVYQLEDYPYASGQKYYTWTNETDLDGYVMDIIGNRTADTDEE